MEIILIILTSTILSALLCFSFYLGYTFKKDENPAKDDAIELDENNRQQIESMLNFIGYNGRG